MKKFSLISLFIAFAAAFQAGAAEPDDGLLSDNILGLPSQIVPAAGMELLDDNFPNLQLAEDMISFAKTHLGTRYRRGGKTPAGFDCSGFTGYVFNKFGFKLGASSRDQYQQGIAVEKKSDVMPGDLLFFNGRAVGSRVGHVGIAIDYDPETDVITFIHSSNSSGISIDKTSAPYYSRRFMGIRRIINAAE